jgi:cytochrome c
MRLGSAATRLLASATAVLLLCLITAQPARAEGLEGARILVMSKTQGFRHASIPAGQDALLAMSREHGFSVTFTEDSSLFTDSELGHFDAVVFLNTTGDILDPAQQASFERYIGSGRGLLGIHAATDTETDGSWPWYNVLIGAKFKSHPRIQEARLILVTPGSSELTHTDEWYDFRDVSPHRRVLVEIDRGSYEGSTANGREPIVWTNDVPGLRAYYIGMGHTDESYASPMMRDMLFEGLRYAVGD